MNGARLSNGVRLGPYEIVSPVGAGGMGEVYKARDTRLDRTVALKVLNANLADNPDLKARFEREARAISQLQHPNICVLHDIGSDAASKTDYLVMEYLEGETLADRLAKGPQPIEQVLRICGDLADALEKAHRAGMVHRDVKPGNVMLTKSGAKLLDFGLAKPVGTALAPMRGSEMQLTAAVTLSSPGPTGSALTTHGSIVGTPQYMSPEQVEGKEADARSDIFAFGAVLYEMATGKRAFEGKTRLKVAASILEEDPPPASSVQPSSPPELDLVIAKCLAKLPEERWHSAGDVGFALKMIEIGRNKQKTELPPAPAKARARAMMAAAVVAAFACGGAAVWFGRPKESGAAPIARAVLALGPDQSLLNTSYPLIAISPDGRTLVHTGTDGKFRGLFKRALDQQESRPIPGTDGGYNPFFSPDGRSVAFVAGSQLKTVSLDAGAPATVFDGISNIRGADWGDDGFIYFTPHYSQGLWRIRAEGGKPEILTKPDFSSGEKTHRWPHVLPGSQAVLFVVGTSRDRTFDEARIELLNLGTKQHHKIGTGAYPQYLSTGHLVFTAGASILAAPFDLGHLEIRGAAKTVQDGVHGYPTYGYSDYTVSRNGTLAYVPGVSILDERTIIAVDRRGETATLAIGPYSTPRISPDGKRLAAYVLGATNQLGIIDIGRSAAPARITYDWDNEDPVWAPDGARLAFVSNRGGGQQNLYLQAADGSGEPERLTTSDHVQYANSWTPDGKTLIYTDADPQSHTDIWALNVAERKSQSLVKTPFEDTDPRLSPDGKWLAYASNQSGQWEVYVQGFPSGGRRWQISNGGGRYPLWNPKGGELFYSDGKAVMAAPVATSLEFQPGTPVPLFNRGGRLFDIMPDGRIIMYNAASQPVRTELKIVVNWFEELKAIRGK